MRWQPSCCVSAIISQLLKFLKHLKHWNSETLKRLDEKRKTRETSLRSWLIVCFIPDPLQPLQTTNLLQTSKVSSNSSLAILLIAFVMYRRSRARVYLMPRERLSRAYSCSLNSCHSCRSWQLLLCASLCLCSVASVFKIVGFSQRSHRLLQRTERKDLIRVHPRLDPISWRAERRPEKFFFGIAFWP